MIKVIILKILIIFLFFINISNASNKDIFVDAKKYFEKKDYDQSKFLFQKYLVFNPKDHLSYLYLAKIYVEEENKNETEKNLNTTLLLNPKNDEAIYMLTLLKIKQSDYDQAKELIDKFNLVCKSFCSKKNEIQKKFKKLIPENAKNNN